MLEFNFIKACFKTLVIAVIINDVYVGSSPPKSSGIGVIEEPYVPGNNRGVNEHNGRLTGKEKDRIHKIKEEIRKHKEEEGVPNSKSEADKLDMSAKYYQLLNRCVKEDGELGKINKKMKTFLNESNLTEENIRQECARLRNLGNGRTKRSYIASGAGVWEKCIIPYVIDSGLKESAKLQLPVTFAYYEKYTGFRFVEFDNNNAGFGLTHNNYLNFIDGGGCWSYVGNLRGGGQNISPCTGQSTQVHEIGHALGFNHEQKNPLSTDYIQFFFNNIDTDYWSQYYRDSINSMAGDDHFYDPSSTMHYADWGFSVNNGRTVIGNDPDIDFMIGMDNDYYLFRDIQPYHSCFAEYETCDTLPTCLNGGYPSVIDGVCACRCPDGLDSSTNCNTVTVLDPPSSWPEGKFTVLKVKDSSCPSGFSEGRMSYMNTEWAWSGGDKMSPGYDDGRTWEQDVCTQTTSSNSGYEWPAGKYCILRYDGTCPTGFSEGLMEYYGGEPPAGGNTGVLPDGTKGLIHQYQFCCRSDADRTTEIRLPTASPFILYQQEYWGCQAVEGMNVIGEYYHMKGLNNDVTVYSGEMPYNYRWRTGMVNTYYCAYFPKSQTECGGVVTFATLAGTTTSLNIQSPNYPSNYNPGDTCLWYFSSPEGTTMKLDFEDFEVSAAEGSCDGYVAIKTYYNGMPSRRFCGHNNLRTHWTYRNTLAVEFLGGLVAYKGFNATITVITDNDKCYHGSGIDGSYAGTVSETQYYNPCVPWKDAVDCLYNQFDPRSIDFDLNNNYCRTVGVGQRPWCYVNAEKCLRENCDACQQGRCFDLDDSCAARIANDAEYCTKDDLGEATRLCKLSCSKCGEPINGPVACGEPSDNGCVYPTSLSESTTNIVGTAVEYTCPSGSEGRTSVCTSEGVWSYVNPICNFCPTGWSVVDKQCFKWLGWQVDVQNADARSRCQELGGDLAKVTSSAVNDFIRAAGDVYTEDSARVWLGIKRDGDSVTWIDGSPITFSSWSNSNFNQDCAYAVNGVWYMSPCQSYRQVVCQFIISDEPVCEDNMPTCEALLESDPDLCSAKPDYAWHNCRATCALDECEVPIECNAEEIDNGDLITSATVYQGEFVEYECDANHYVTSGKLKRACLPSGQWTGSIPVCSPKEETRRVEFYADKELFDRGSYTTRRPQLSPDVESARIPIDGYVSEWIFYSSAEGENVAFQVWRATDDETRYTFIGENVITTDVDNGKMIARIPLTDQIEAQAGDLIGIHNGNGGAVRYDACDPDYMPENSYWYTLSSTPNVGSTLSEGTTYGFDKQTCRIYSFRVTMNPCGCE